MVHQCFSHQLFHDLTDDASETHRCIIVGGHSVAFLENWAHVRPIFHSEGSSPVSRVSLNRCARGKVSSLAATERILGGSPSGPAAFPGCRPANSCLTPSAVIKTSSLDSLKSYSGTSGTGPESSVVKTLLKFFFQKFSLFSISLGSVAIFVFQIRDTTLARYL